MTNTPPPPATTHLKPPGVVLEREIASQPDTITHFLAKQLEPVTQIVRSLPRFSYVLIAARGSSDHAAEYARYVLPALWGTPVASATPSLHTHYKTPPRLDDALVVGISQSGQSPDIVAVLQEARAQGRPTIAITNDGASPLAAAADHVIELHAGIERSIAATKTYTCQLAAVALLAAARAPRDPAGDEDRLAALAAIPAAMELTLAGAERAAITLAEKWRDISRCLIFARGINLGTAHEIALKLRELLRLQTQAFSAADFRHGSVAVLEPGLPALVVAPTDLALGDVMDLTSTLRAQDADVVVLSETPRPDCGWLPLAAHVAPWLTPLVAVLPAQRLAVALSRAKGLDADLPQGLTEKVVRTT